MRDSEGTADPPIAGTIHSDPLGSIVLKHVNGTAGATFGFGIQGHAGPETLVQHHPNGVLFHMINDAALWLNTGLVFESIQNQTSAFVFVFQMRRVNQDQLIMLCSDFDMPLKLFKFIGTVFIQTKFSNSQHIGFVDELGNQLHDFLGKMKIFRFLGIDA